MTPSTFRFAMGYVRRNWAPIPIPAKSKAPTINGWQHLRLKESDDLARHFSNGGNIGLLLGEPSGDLVDADVDCPIARHLAPEFLPPTELMSGRASAPRSHYWYTAKLQTEKFVDPICEDRTQSMIVEIRSSGTQTIVAPSIHPSGEQCEWHSKADPARVEPDVLRQAVRSLAACALLARYWAAGKRHELSLAVAGALLRHGWTPARVAHVVVCAARGAGDPEVEDRRKAVETTAQRLAADRKCNGIPALRNLLPAAVADKIIEWLALDNSFVSFVASETKKEFEPEPIPWPELDQAALHGLVGKLVGAIEPETESDPVAVLLQALVCFGNCIGRSVYFRVEQTRHYLNLNAVIVGTSAKSRKGTAEGRVRYVFESIDEEWASERIQSGLSSGEGLIWAVRDPIEEKRPIREKGRTVGYETVISDHGVEDKRLLVIETEFASVLRVMGRDGNTLSPVIRQAWDSGRLRVLTKNSPARATGAHISIVGHITIDELRRNLDETETANGFANRILWAVARRSKLLPEGGGSLNLSSLILRFHEAVEFAQNFDGEIKRDDEACALWFEIYEELSAGDSGLLGSVTSRAEAQVMRLAGIYALLDRSSTICADHLRAALALWVYCHASAAYIFGQATGDRVADTIVAALREIAPDGLTRTQISDLLARKQNAAAISRSLTLLQERGLVRVKQEPTDGRPRIRYFYVREAKKAKKAKKAPGEGDLNSLNSLNSPSDLAAKAPEAEPAAKDDQHDADDSHLQDVPARSFFEELRRDPEHWQEFETEMIERSAVLEFEGKLSRAEADTRAEAEVAGQWIRDRRLEAVAG